MKHLYLRLLLLSVAWHSGVYSFSALPPDNNVLPDWLMETKKTLSIDDIFTTKRISTFIGSVCVGVFLTLQPLQVSNAAESTTTGGMSCALQNCAGTLQNCMTDRRCARGLTCLLRCTANKATEGACQVRCMDLYENEAMEDLTECTLTKYGCYPALPADPNFPAISESLADTKVDASSLLPGTWYVTAGYNRAFDCFDCQQHTFTAIDDKTIDATFQYRIRRDDGSYFTRSGDKRLRLTKPGRLELQLRPNRMNYRDDWTILAAEPNVYMVVHYHGTNAAWDGNGGLNVYTRQGQLPTEPEYLAGMERGLSKVGLSLKDLAVVDNSCPPIE